ncbi:RidA family protein [Candidatus Paracaedibacter symbiosus]|uniref:RidA family protein n=1 Tax=Candidatus Paracaedibacter symbiosus TaxID=244582 RepID=UPI0005094F1F|nr:RidA family protein [Candidatus Paracaedibacter symbiosus]
MPFTQKLKELGLNLTIVPPAVANYVGFQVVGNLVIISGQLPIKDGQVAIKGKVGAEINLEQAIEAARLCAINILTQLNTACGGDLSKVERCVRLGGFVNCTADYTDQPKVINGASDLMVAVFGDAGRHARAAVGVNALPLGAAVEVEAIFSLKA